MQKIPKQDLAALFDARIKLEDHTPLIVTAAPEWTAFMAAARAAIFAAAAAVGGDRYAVLPCLGHAPVRGLGGSAGLATEGATAAGTTDVPACNFPLGE